MKTLTKIQFNNQLSFTITLMHFVHILWLQKCTKRKFENYFKQFVNQRKKKLYLSYKMNNR